MATVNSALSFQGLSTGIQTDSLVSAILAQEGKTLRAFQDRQKRIKAQSSALTSMKSSISGFSTSLAALLDKFDARAVSSSDANGTNVTATAVGAPAGSYEVKVTTVATKARISPTLSFTGSSSNPVVAFTSATAKTTVGSVAFNISSFTGGGPVSGTFTVGGTDYVLSGTNGTLTGAAGTPLEGLSVSVTGTGSGTLNLVPVASNLSVSNPATTPIFSGALATFAVQGTDGVVKTFDVASNSLNGLRDAINAQGAGVTASIINTGSGANPYQLVITAKETGRGVTNGVVSLAEVTSGGMATNSLGIGFGTVDNSGATPVITGGVTSATSGTIAQDAVFTVNGIQLTRQSNVVKDAADGVIFTLKQGGQTGITTLTVAQDKAAALTAMQDVITRYNALVTAYRQASTSTKDADGAIVKAPLDGDATARTMMSQIKATLVGPSAGLEASYSMLSSLGVQTFADGTLGLNTVTFQNAVEKDPMAARRIFSVAGDSDNGVLAFKSASDKTPTGPIAFVVSESGGVFSGTFNGVAAVAGPNGTLNGTGAYEGLSVTVSAAGSGTLTIKRGAGQAVRDLIAGFTASGSGTIANALKTIETQNKSLDTQITSATSALDRRKKVLQAQFSKMEVAVAKLRSSAGALSGV